MKATIDTFLVAHRDPLQEIMDALIPADVERSMPSASEAGVLDEYLRKALMARDDLAPGFIAAIERVAALRVRDLDALLSVAEADFGIISRVIAGAYFMNGAINEKLGYRGQQEVRETVDYDEIIGLIEAPMERGDIYTHV